MKEFLEKNFDFRKLLKSFLVIYLFFYRSIFSLIPMVLFYLDECKNVKLSNIKDCKVEPDTNNNHVEVKRGKNNE